MNDTFFNAWNAIPPQRPNKLSAFLGTITRNLSLKKWEQYSTAKRGLGQVPLALEELQDCIPALENVEQVVDDLKEELQAGYDRHWKASHNILVTMEEFLAEAGKKHSDPAAGTYEALVGLVEEKKLRPGEVLVFAHFHWCLNKPEAVIAYQTRPKEWAVNNCGAEITVEQAQVEICEEWGFETNRVRIIGTPLL